MWSPPSWWGASGKGLRCSPHEHAVVHSDHFLDAENTLTRKKTSWQTLSSWCSLTAQFSGKRSCSHDVRVKSSFCFVTCLLFMLFLSSVFILHLINNNLSYYYDILVHDLHPQMYIVKFSLPQHLNKEKENVQQYQLMEGDLTHSWLIIGIINV